MTLFARKRSRSLGKARRGHSDTQENYPLPNLNVQLSRENPEHEHVLALQQTVGNIKTQQILQSGTAPSIQRMPTSVVVENKLGKPKKDSKFLGKTKLNSTKYKAVLAALKAFEGYAVSTFLAQDSSGLRGQMTAVNHLLQTVYEKMNAYQGEKGKKAVYMLTHLGEVKTFQNIAARAFLDKIDKPGGSQHMFLGSSLNGFLNKALREGSQPPLRLNFQDKVGSQTGGSKTVEKYDTGGDNLGYFSDQKNTINDVDPGNPNQVAKWNEIKAEIRNQVEHEGQEKQWSREEIELTISRRQNAKMNEVNIGVLDLGIKPDDARMNQRDIAMSRLDQLLGTNIIARAQFAVVHMPDGTEREGSIMEGAEGMSPNDYIEEANEQGGSQQEIIKNRQDAIGINDPELMRQLSRLQLIDIIATQVDRNIGNYFINRDKDGKLIGFTGIDNDFAFGTNSDPDKHIQQLPGISRYVDKELAEKIIALDPSLLESILSDLLPEQEVQAAVARLEKLKTELQSNLTNFLKLDEWAQHAQDLVQEGKSYYSNLEWKMRDQRSAKGN